MHIYSLCLLKFKFSAPYSSQKGQFFFLHISNVLGPSFWTGPFALLWLPFFIILILFPSPPPFPWLMWEPNGSKKDIQMLLFSFVSKIGQCQVVDATTEEEMCTMSRYVNTSSSSRWIDWLSSWPSIPRWLLIINSHSSSHAIQSEPRNISNLAIFALSSMWKAFCKEGCRLWIVC